MGSSAARCRAARAACRRPTSFSGISVWPWNRRSTLYVVWPCRQRTRVTPSPAPPCQLPGAPAPPVVGNLAPICGAGAVAADRPDGLGQRDHRAVLPQPLERVEDPLL